LKEKLKVWNKVSFGNAHVLVREAEEKLQVIQDNIDSLGHSDDLLEQQKKAQFDLQKALDIEESFWQEKSRINWHIHGDRNTSYFHKVTKIKQTTKLISSLRDGDDIITDLELIASHTTNYFKNIFCASSFLLVNSLVEDCIPKLVNDYSNNILTMTPTDEEIHNAIFSLNGDSAPSPDGFGAIFFKHYWSIIKSEVINAVQEFFITGKMLNNFNSNP